MRKFDYNFLKDNDIPSQTVNLLNSFEAKNGQFKLLLNKYPEIFAELTKIAIVQSVRSSNAIEGIVTTDARIIKLLESKVAPRNHDEQEILGYKDALNKIHLEHENMQFSNEEIDGLRRQYRMTTFQKIIGRPVWMITRPNCRHYFTRIAAKDITGKSYKQIVQDKDMFLQEGNRPRMQTYRHPTKREWYTRQNAQMMVDKYKDRLKIHRDLYAIDRNKFIARAIKKDRLLIKKWENML